MEEQDIHLLEMEDPAHGVNDFVPDYVIVYNESEDFTRLQKLFISFTRICNNMGCNFEIPTVQHNMSGERRFVLDRFLEKLRTELELNCRIIQSEISERVKYMAIQAPRHVLTQRAVINKTAVPIEIRVIDMMEWENVTPDYPELFCYQIFINIIKNRSRRAISFTCDLFTPNLKSGYMKIEYDKRFDEHFLHPDREDPFQLSRIRSNLVHDLIKDIDLTEDISSNSDFSSLITATEYRGLEWMKRSKYVARSFVPHHIGDRSRSKRMAQERGWIFSVTSLREYLGEKVAFSFAWRSAWLTSGLMLPMIAGIIVFIYGLFTYRERQNKDRIPENDNGSRNASVYSLLFDTPALPYYAIIFNCTLPIIMLTSMWIRFRNIYGFKWGVLNYFLYNERRVLKFSALEDNITPSQKLLFKLGSLLLATFLLCICAGYNFLTILVQQIFKELLRRQGLDPNQAFAVSQFTVSLLNCIFVVLVINPFFASFSYWITSKELHFFHSDFERSLTWRIFFYSFVNNNMRLFMILFFPRFKIGGIFPHQRYQLIEFCAEGQCLETAFYQLVAFLFVKPLGGSLGFIYHYLKYHIWCRCSTHPKKHSMSDTLATRLDRDNSLYTSSKFETSERYQTLWDMNNRVAQYGFVVMFGAVFPLAPLIALCVEIVLRRADIFRYLYRQIRPVPRRHEGIGSWEEIIDFVNMVGIVTNVWIISFRSRYGTKFLDFLIDWTELYGENGKAMFAFVLMSALCLIKFGIRAVSQFYSVPELVKLFHRQEADEAENFLRQHN